MDKLPDAKCAGEGKTVLPRSQERKMAAWRHGVRWQLGVRSNKRWIERHDAVSQFRESLGTIAKALETFSQWQEESSAAKARSLLTLVLDSEFIIATLALYDVLSVTLPLSRQLQKPDLEMN